MGLSRHHPIPPCAYARAVPGDVYQSLTKSAVTSPPDEKTHSPRGSSYHSHCISDVARSEYAVRITAQRPTSSRLQCTYRPPRAISHCMYFSNFCPEAGRTHSDLTSDAPFTASADDTSSTAYMRLCGFSTCTSRVPSCTSLPDHRVVCATGSFPRSPLTRLFSPALALEDDADEEPRYVAHPTRCLSACTMIMKHRLVLDSASLSALNS